MTKVPEEYMVVSEVDCPVVDTLKQAKTTALEHFDGESSLNEVKIYKLVSIANREIKFT